MIASEEENYINVKIIGSFVIDKNKINFNINDLENIFLKVEPILHFV